MKFVRRFAGLLLLVTLAVSLSGCALLHEFRFHRLHRWNRGEALGGGTEAYFSVVDPVEADESDGFVDLDEEPIER